MQRRALWILMAAVGLVGAACAAPSGDASSAEGDPTTTISSAPAAGGELPEGPSALQDMRHADFPEPLVDPGEIRSGGPPPDGIPSIDDPQFVSVEDAEAWVEPEEPVVYLEMGGETRIYPVQILMWHEIVNDTVAGVPVTVTYCPLCNSAVSYERTVRGVETTFGTSGRLFNSALVMYDRATESLWTHYDGRAVVGTLTGEVLEPIPSPLAAFEDIASNRPDALVLDRERTGHDRPYGSNPYGGYDDPGRRPFLFSGDVDDRAAAMQRVVGVTLGEEARAWSLEAISDGSQQVTEAELGGTLLVIFWKSGQSSALEDNSVSGGRDVGSVAVFVRDLEGAELTFRVDGEHFVDDQTGSRWNILGEAVEGELEGTRLEQVHHLDTFWFAWASYQPETDLVSG